MNRHTVVGLLRSSLAHRLLWLVCCAAETRWGFVKASGTVTDAALALEGCPEAAVQPGFAKAMLNHSYGQPVVGNSSASGGVTVPGSSPGTAQGTGRLVTCSLALCTPARHPARGTARRRRQNLCVCACWSAGIAGKGCCKIPELTEFAPVSDV